MWRRMSSRGMTLIELLTVVAIIMVVVALALPNFASMVRSQRWSAASGALQNALIRCQTFAVTDRRDHSIEICPSADNNSVYFRIEVESALIEGIAEMNSYYANQCDYYYMRLPFDWIGAFCAAGGDIQNMASSPWLREPATRFNYAGPKYDVDRGDWRIPNTIKDNLKVDDNIYLPYSITIDFANSAHLMNYDPPPSNVNSMPQYGWDYTRDLRFNMTGTLVQAQNPEIVLVNPTKEHMRLQVLRSTARVRKLSGLN